MGLCKQMVFMCQHVETILGFLTQKGVQSTPRPALVFITLHFVSLSAHKTWIIVCMYHNLPFHFQTAGHMVVFNLLQPQHCCARSPGTWVPLHSCEHFCKMPSRDGPALPWYVRLTLGDTRGISYLPALTRLNTFGASCAGIRGGG